MPTLDDDGIRMLVTITIVVVVVVVTVIITFRNPKRPKNKMKLRKW